MSNSITSLSYDVIKYHIYPYLNIRDKLLLNLSGVKPLFNINVEFGKCIRLRMHKLGFTEENVTELFKAMKADHAVISGSFILQCIYNETYDNSDIDIYYLLTGKYHHSKKKLPRRIYMNERETFVHVGGYRSNNKPLLTYLTNTFDDNVDDNWIHGYGVLDMSSRYFTRNHLKINYIEINDQDNIYNSIYNSISKNFDLEFCKCTYDGEILRIKNFDSIINKHSLINIDDIIKKKQLSNMFYFSTHMEIRKQVLHRINKYTDRGYQINTQEKNHKIVSKRDKKLIDKRRFTIIKEIVDVLLPFDRHQKCDLIQLSIFGTTTTIYGDALANIQRLYTNPNTMEDIDAILLNIYTEANIKIDKFDCNGLSSNRPEKISNNELSHYLDESEDKKRTKQVKIINDIIVDNLFTGYFINY